MDKIHLSFLLFYCTCIRITVVLACTLPRDIENGYAFEQGGILKYQCDEGYILEGRQENVCLQGSANWVYPHPKCVYQLKSCMLPRDIENGYAFEQGGILKYHCDEGYILEGRQENVCLQGSTNWVYPHPKCVYQLKSCTLPRDIENGYAFEQGGILKYHCDEGYILMGREENVCLQGSNDWIYPHPKCVVTQCPSLPDVDFGDWSMVNLDHGTEASLQCHYGYTVQGSTSIKCQAGTWVPELPRCYLPKCDMPDIKGRNIRKTYGTNEVYDFISFECTEPDMEMLGASEITCDEDLKWDNELPLCREKSETFDDPDCNFVSIDDDTSGVLHKFNKCYKFVNTEVTWYTAEKACRNDGGRLVTIESLEQNTWLIDSMRDLDWTNNGVWIGLKYKYGSWRWVTENEDEREAVEYDNRKETSLIPLSTSCLTLRLENGYWQKKPCYLRPYVYKYICRYDLPSHEYHWDY